jgi:glycerol-3-phosphate dehydrogenase
MASDVVRIVLSALGQKRGPDRARSLPLPGGDFGAVEPLVASAVALTKDATLARHLVTSYGTRWNRVWEEIACTDGQTIVADGLPYTLGELRYCIRHEKAYTLGDLLIRRTHLAYETVDHGMAAALRVAALLPLGAEAAEAIRDYEGGARHVRRRQDVSGWCLGG